MYPLGLYILSIALFASEIWGKLNNKGDNTPYSYSTYATRLTKQLRKRRPFKSLPKTTAKGSSNTAFPYRIHSYSTTEEMPHRNMYEDGELGMQVHTQISVTPLHNAALKNRLGVVSPWSNGEQACGCSITRG